MPRYSSHRLIQPGLSCASVFEDLQRFYVAKNQKLTMLLLAFRTVGKVVEHVDEQLIDRHRQLFHSLLAAQVCEMQIHPMSRTCS